MKNVTVQTTINQTLARNEIRRRGLRAAFAVAFSGTVGCGAAVDTTAAGTGASVDAGDSTIAASDVAAAADSVALADAAVAAETATAADSAQPSDTQPLSDLAAADIPLDSAVAADVAHADDAVADADAGGKCSVYAPGSAEYDKCCADENWDFNAGCMAWGPPVPPTMAA